MNWSSCPAVIDSGDPDAAEDPQNESTAASIPAHEMHDGIEVLETVAPSNLSPQNELTPIPTAIPDGPEPEDTTATSER